MGWQPMAVCVRVMATQTREKGIMKYRFDKATADRTIARFNAMLGLDGIEPGSLYRYSADGRQMLCRVSMGRAQQEVSFGMSTSRDIIIAVNAMIDQHSSEILLRGSTWHT